MYRNIIRVVAVLFAAFAAAMALPGFYRMVPASWHGDYKKNRLFGSSGRFHHLEKHLFQRSVRQVRHPVRNPGFEGQRLHARTGRYAGRA